MSGRHFDKATARCLQRGFSHTHQSPGRAVGSNPADRTPRPRLRRYKCPVVGVNHPGWGPGTPAALIRRQGEIRTPNAWRPVPGTSSRNTPAVATGGRAANRAETVSVVCPHADWPLSLPSAIKKTEPGVVIIYTSLPQLLQKWWAGASACPHSGQVLAAAAVSALGAVAVAVRWMFTCAAATRSASVDRARRRCGRC